MTGALLPHQESGAKWLAPLPHAYLADPPGRGKTRTAIAGLQLRGTARALVICPAIVRSFWWQELTAMGWDVAAFTPGVYSYDEINRGGIELMQRIVPRYDALILDEAHYLKHPHAQRTRAILGRDGYAPRFETCWALSGTPTPRNPLELWPLASALFPRVCLAHGLRTTADWEDRFCTVITHQYLGHTIRKIVPPIKNAQEFHAILETFMLRRAPDPDEPDIWWQTIPLDFTGELDTLDREALLRVSYYQEQLEMIATDPLVARMRRRVGELKVAPVLDLLRQQLANSDEKVVVFAHHRAVLDRLRHGLAAFGVAYIDGDVAPAARDFAMNSFQTEPGVRVFLGQNIACQTGITLHAAHRVILVEPDWTATVNNQLAHRVARIGQRVRQCIVQMIALAGSIDESVVRQNAREAAMVETMLSPITHQEASPCIVA